MFSTVCTIRQFFYFLLLSFDDGHEIAFYNHEIYRFAFVIKFSGVCDELFAVVIYRNFVRSPIFTSRISVLAPAGKIEL